MVMVPVVAWLAQEASVTFWLTRHAHDQTDRLLVPRILPPTRHNEEENENPALRLAWLLLWPDTKPWANNNACRQ